MGIKEIIKKAKSGAPNALIYDFIIEFEDFASKIEQIRSKNAPREQERKEVSELMSEAYDRLRIKLGEAAAHYGMSVEQLHRALSNSVNFASGDWIEVQKIKGELAEHLGLPSETKKKQRRNKNLRV